MKLIVGLGNPGVEYERTRHNVGFRVVDAFARKFRIAIDRHEKDAMTGRGRVAGETVVLARPLTYMNLSGSAVGKLVRPLETLDDLIVVYDDIDLPLGKLRIREAGSPGTHNGMKSISGSLHTDRFPRLRFGIRGETLAPGRDLAEYVLADFEPAEEELVERTVERAVEALVMLVRGELRRAMNQFNRDPKAEESKPS